MLALNLLVSESVKNRASLVSYMTFYNRGIIKFRDEEIDTFWARLVEADETNEEDDKRTVVMSATSSVR